MGFGSLQRVFPLVLLLTLTAVTRCTDIVNVTAPVGQLGGVRETLNVTRLQIRYCDVILGNSVRRTTARASPLP